MLGGSIRDQCCVNVGRQINGVKTRGWPKRNWIDDIEEWTNVKDYSEVRKQKLVNGLDSQGRHLGGGEHGGSADPPKDCEV